MLQRAIYALVFVVVVSGARVQPRQEHQHASTSWSSCTSYFNESASVLVTEAEPMTNTTIESNVGNGYIATVINSDSIYMAGVYSGRNYSSPSERARIPSTIAITIPGTMPCGSALDMERAVFTRRTEVESGVYVSQSWFAHRTFRSILVHTLTATENVTVPLSNGQGNYTSNLDTTVVPSSVCNLTQGVISETEVPNGVIVQVGVCASYVPPSIDLVAGQTVMFVTAARSSLDSPDPVDAALSDFETALELGPEELLASHTAAWAELWEGGIRVGGSYSSGISSTAAHINASLYYILSAVRTDWPWPPTPGGVAVDAYHGHAFWDSETWMFPNLLVFNPDLAGVTLEYRNARVPTAQANAESFGWNGTWFPWESAFTGVECCPSWAPEGRYEQHIVGDIAMATRLYYYATNNVTWLAETGWPIIKGAAEFWASRVTLQHHKGSGGWVYGIENVIPPDEDAGVVNNSCYTNTIAGLSMEWATEVAGLIGATAPAEWAEIAAQMYIPFNSSLDIHDEFEGYDGQTIKQADVVLLQYPLNVSMPRTVALNDIAYYQPRTKTNGDYTGDNAYSIAWLDLGNATAAAVPYSAAYGHMQGPFIVWQEELIGGHNNFITGAGGFLQNIINGYGGLRYGPSGLRLAPTLPPPMFAGETIDSLTIHGVNYLGSVLDYTGTATDITLTVTSAGPTTLYAVSTSINECVTLLPGAITVLKTAEVVIVSSPC